jgi:gamma-glutamylcyclotransferase (GGCT)/AIG2-like uncharacterized protein YtfP|tara:strand:+ start:186 stop:638 length:453 start_codon:yes stop_codon:yes gene_type:complete
MPKKDKKPAYFTEEQEMFKVFVYGTLKSGGDIRGLNQFGDGANIVGKAKTTYPDYEMIDLGAFPGVLEGGEHHIEGEVWEVDAETLMQLDAIEGYSGKPSENFYNRIVVVTDKGKAFMYVLDKKVYGSMHDPDSKSIETYNNVQRWNLSI